jgi:hypothetical protein
MQHLENAYTKDAYGKRPVTLIIDVSLRAGSIVLQGSEQ